MKQLLLLILILISYPFLKANGQAPDWKWARIAGGVNYAISGESATVDKDGNVYEVGTFLSSTLTFGNIILTNNSNYSLNDMYIVKYDSTGNVLWAQTQNGVIGITTYSVTTDKAGNVYVTGMYSDSTIIFDTTTYNTNGNAGIFTVKYDPLGHIIWEKNIIGGGEQSMISVDKDGYVFVAGDFSTPFEVDSVIIYPGNSMSMILVKYDSLGNVIWAKSDGQADMPTAIVADSFGNVYVSGTYLNTCAFGNTTLINDNFISPKIFLLKYNNIGEIVWAKSLDGAGGDQANSLTMDVFGNVVMAGSLASPTLTLGNNTITNNYPYFPISGSSGGYYSMEDLFVAKYDSSGNNIWARSIGGRENDIGVGVVTDSLGNIYLAGYFRSDTINIGSSIIINKNSANDPELGVSWATGDMLIVKYDGGGNVQWAKSNGGDENDVIAGIAIDRTGNLYVTGFYESPVISFGDTTFVYDTTTCPSIQVTPTYTYYGYDYVFLAKLGSTINEIDSTTSVNKIIANNNNSVNVYPNPTKDKLNIITQSAGGSYTLMNIIGTSLLSGTLQQGNNHVSMNGFASGMYILEMRDSNGAVKVMRVVKE